jgi:SAM-dependent methyltransferase
MKTISDNCANLDAALQNLTFPLNVYATLVQSESGELAGLGYGCMLPFETDLPSAQLRMTIKIQKSIVASPGAWVLDVGCGSGLLLQQLVECGYQVVGIDNNEAALALAECRLGPDCSQSALVHGAFEAFSDDHRFDVIVMQNSLRYLLPLVAFNKVQHLLKPGGQLLIFEEFVSDDQTRQHQPLPVLKHVLALARRLEFELSASTDLSKDVIPFMKQLRGLLDKRFGEAVERCRIAPGDMNRLLGALVSDIQKCEQGRLVHCLLDLRAPDLPGRDEMPVPATELLPSEALGEADYRDLFEKSFKTVFDPALWRWKYAQGRGHSVVALQHGKPVAHYGGISRNIFYFGEPDLAVQICDVMVLPERRGFFSKNGLFFKTAASMLEQYAGNTATHLLGFGFPNIKAMHVAERLGLYEKTDELVALSYGSEVVGTQDRWQVAEVSSKRAIGELSDVLWNRMLASSGSRIIGVRDSHYLHYRFMERPGINYRCLAVTSADETMALAFVREHGEQGLIMDIIGDANHLSPALKALCRHGHTQGRPMLFWITAGQLAVLADPAMQVDATGIHIPCNSWSTGPTASRLAGAWWLTAGDMDFL